MMTNKIGVQSAILMAVFIAFWGCSPGNELLSGSSDRQTRIVMNVLSIFYGEYLESHQGQAPKSNDDFRNYLESDPEKLNRYKIEQLDQLLISPRDGLPLVIVCGKRIAPRDAQGTPWAAYEKTGVDGIKMAVQVRGGVHEISSDEIDRIFRGL
jgi:hypothetical protein